MSSLQIFLAFAFVAFLAQGIDGQRFISFHDHRGCIGDRFGAELSYTCQNLPRGVVREWRQLSIDTNGACISLYDDWDCEGKEVANFNNARCRNVFAISQIKSYRQCSGRTNSAVISG